MTDATPAATPSENPASETVTGSQSAEPEAEESEGAPAATHMPDEAYRGLQRRISDKDRKITDLEGQIEGAKAEPGTNAAEFDMIVSGLIGEIAKTDPDRAQQLTAGVVTYKVNRENQQLKAGAQAQERETETAVIQRENREVLEGMAQDYGIDSASSLVDYGSDDEPLAARMQKVMLSAKAAAQPAEVVTPPPPPADAPVIQPGTPATPVTEGEIVHDKVHAAVQTYRDNPTQANMESYLKLQDDYDRQQLGL